MSHVCTCPMSTRAQVESLHEVYLLLDTDEAAAVVQLRESLDTLHQGEPGVISMSHTAAS